MADGKCKACSFYVPERDVELMRFMASQSNMSLSMRLLMKAFLASNRHATDIDVSLMDLADLIRSMRVDPELFDDVPRNRRPARSISAIEAEEARAAEQAALERQAGQAPAPGRIERSEPGFARTGSGEASGYPGPVPGIRQEPDGYGPDGQGGPAAGSGSWRDRPEPAGTRPEQEFGSPLPAQEQAPEPAPAAGRPQPMGAPGSGMAGGDDLDPMSMMGDGF